MSIFFLFLEGPHGSFFFIFFFLIYFWQHWIFAAVLRLSLVLESRGVRLCCSTRACPCGAFSCCGAWALRRAGLSSCGSQALVCGLSGYGTWAWLLGGMWALPGPGIEPVSPASAGRILFTVPPGRVPHIVLEGYMEGRILLLKKRLSCLCSELFGKRFLLKHGYRLCVWVPWIPVTLDLLTHRINTVVECDPPFRTMFYKENMFVVPLQGLWVQLLPQVTFHAHSLLPWTSWPS